MADRTAIEWADATLNPIKARMLSGTRLGRIGDFCEKVSPGCANCYAETNNVFRGTGLPYKPGHRPDVELFLNEAKLREPLAWRRPRRIFVASLTDLFADFVPDWMLDRIFAVAALTERHTYQILTKRSVRMRAYLSDPAVVARIALAMGAIAGACTMEDKVRGGEIVGRMASGELWPLPNVWLGVSTEDQRRADERIPDLLATPAAVIFVSAEPLLGPIDYTRIEVPIGGELDALRGTWAAAPFSSVGGRVYIHTGAPARKIDLIIVGGESGVLARPMHPEWAESIGDQCEAASTAFFFKQWGTWAWAPADLNFADARAWITQRFGGVEVRTFSSGRTAYRAGKGRTVRLVHGRTYDAMPEVRLGH